MRRLNLRDRVTLASALALVVGLAVLTIGVWALVSHRLDADESAALQERVDAQLATLDIRPGDRIVVRDTVNDEALDRQAWIYGSDRRVIQRAAAPADVQRAADELARRATPSQRSVRERIRLQSEPIRDEQGRPRGTVVVGLSLKPYEDTQHVVLLATLVIDLFVLLAGTLLVRAAVTRALRPVAEMTERAADWSAHDLDRRFDLGPPNDELTALSETLDGLLARIASSIRHEQLFSAEVAHELRTPLTGVRGEAELALRDPDIDPGAREALERVLRGTERMETVIETLLAAARGVAGTAPGAADAAAAVDAAIAAVHPTADQGGVVIDVEVPTGRLRVGADVDIVAQALQPLLDNAVRHARTRVRVTTEREGGQVVFAVADDGPGLGDDMNDPFEPGGSTAGGAGLGLPLARRLARSCGGEVSARADARGGHFELRLPAVA
jgi:signal transduction histidine kinase